MSTKPLKPCLQNGTHELPAGEESWNEPACDTLVAAALDGCRPCQDKLGRAITESVTDAFGRLFTTWVMGALCLRMQWGLPLPENENALGLFGSAPISEPSKTVLRGVRLPKHGPGSAVGDRMMASMAVVAMAGINTGEAVEALQRMTASQRLAVLGDVLDGIVGETTLRLGAV